MTDCISDTKKQKVKPVKIVLWCILGIVLALILIALSSLLVQKYIKKTPVPNIMGYSYMMVLTGSMNGTIDKDDLIIIKRTDDYKNGDIVTFLDSNGTVVTHRIIRTENGKFITKGDANEKEDNDPISESQIFGEKIAVIPKVGIVLRWFTQGGGIIYAVAFVVVLCGGVYLWNVVNSDEDKSDKTEEAPQPKEESQDDNKL